MESVAGVADSSPAAPKSIPTCENMLRSPPVDSPSSGGMQVLVASYQFGIRRLTTTETMAAVSVAR